MKRKTSVPKNAFDTILLLVFLIAGLVVGAVVASYINENTASALISSISDSWLNTSSISLLQTIWNTFKYPFFVFLLSFTFLGIIFIPLVLSLKGYLISFSIGTLIKLYGVPGLVLAVSTFGIQSLLLFPCLFLLSLKSFGIAKEQIRFLSGGKYSFKKIFFARHYILTLGICFCVLTILALTEFFITPHIIKHVFNNLI